MTPDALSAVEARIAVIEQQFGVRRAGMAQAGPSVGTASFDDALVAAMAGGAPTDATAVAAGPGLAALLLSARTRVDADGVPLELRAYGNGRVPASALTPISQGSHRLWDPAARAFEAMAAAAARDGVTIDVTDSYRSYEAQVDLAQRKGLYSEGGLAARPGTSDHGWGTTIDIDVAGGTGEWMRANAGRFGFKEDVPREPWHWHFDP